VQALARGGAEGGLGESKTQDYLEAPCFFLHLSSHFNGGLLWSRQAFVRSPVDPSQRFTGVGTECSFLQVYSPSLLFRVPVCLFRPRQADSQHSVRLSCRRAKLVFTFDQSPLLTIVIDHSAAHIVRRSKRHCTATWRKKKEEE
jgi:hypothetical protein